MSSLVASMNKHISTEDASLAAMMGKAAISSSFGGSYEFTPAEIDVMKQVIAEVIDRGIGRSKINSHAIAITCLNQKLRVSDCADKYIAWLEAIAVFNINDFGDVINGFDDYDANLAPRLASYSLAGKDSQNRDIFWINGSSPVTVPQEREAVRAGVLYFLAIHSDPVSLRNGITFVIDVSANKANVGNEKKLQKVWQSFPLRPQRILIMGAGSLKRIFINGVIKFASLFSKAKILERIQFVDRQMVVGELGEVNVPRYVNGDSGKGFVGEKDIGVWVKERVQAFPNLDQVLGL
jgi:hypothetical protein